MIDPTLNCSVCLPDGKRSMRGDVDPTAERCSTGTVTTTGISSSKTWHEETDELAARNDRRKIQHRIRRTSSERDQASPQIPTLLLPVPLAVARSTERLPRPSARN
jgi:hypothetical protein